MRKQPPIISKSSNYQYQLPPGSHLQQGFPPEGGFASSGDTQSICRHLDCHHHHCRRALLASSAANHPTGHRAASPSNKGSGPNANSLEVGKL